MTKNGKKFGSGIRRTFQNANLISTTLYDKVADETILVAIAIGFPNVQGFDGHLIFLLSPNSWCDCPGGDCSFLYKALFTWTSLTPLLRANDRAVEMSPTLNVLDGILGNQ